MIPNNICVVRSTNKGCTHWCIHEASRSMSKNGFVWKCSSKIPWTILLPFKKLQFSSGYPYGISKKTWIKRNGSTPRYGSKLGNPPSKHGWSWLGHPRSKWRFLEGEPPMAQFSNGSWWISSFASGSWRKSIRKGGFTIKNGGLAINKMVVEPTRNGFSMIQFDLQYFHYPLNYPKPTSLAPENPRSQRKELFSNSSTHGYVARSSTLVVGSPMSCPSKPQAKVPWQHMDPSCGIKQLGMDKAIPKGQPWKADYSIFFAAPGSTLTHITMKFGKSVSAFPMESGSSNQTSPFFLGNISLVLLIFIRWKSSNTSEGPKTIPWETLLLVLHQIHQHPQRFRLGPISGAMAPLWWLWFWFVSWELSWLCLKMETLPPNF